MPIFNTMPTAVFILAWLIFPGLAGLYLRFVRKRYIPKNRLSILLGCQIIFLILSAVVIFVFRGARYDFYGYLTDYLFILGLIISSALLFLYSSGRRLLAMYSGVIAMVTTLIFPSCLITIMGTQPVYSDSKIRIEHRGAFMTLVPSLRIVEKKFPFDYYTGRANYPFGEEALPITIAKAEIKDTMLHVLLKHNSTDFMDPLDTLLVITPK
jgi:hypothetical protein